MSDPRLHMGGNNPPDPTLPEQIEAQLEVLYPNLLNRRDELRGALAAFVSQHPTIGSDEVASAATENLRMVDKAVLMGERLRKQTKEPHLIAGRTIDAWFKAIETDLVKASTGLRGSAAAYAFTVAQQRRQQRAAEAAAIQARADVAALAAREAAEVEVAQRGHAYDDAIKLARQAEKALDRIEDLSETSQVVGQFGSTSSLQERWEARVLTPDDVPREYCSPDPTLLRAAVLAGVRTIPGCAIQMVQSLRTRS